MGEKGEGFSGTTIKNTWTKPRWGWKQGRDDWGGGGVVGGKCRQLYLNNNNIILNKRKKK